MRQFLLKVSAFISLVLLLLFVVFASADGDTDPFYLRFTSPKASALIVGTSRAAQGLQPSVFNAVLGRADVYNYSFTVVHSPYGPSYYRSIGKKLDERTRSGVFIVTVDPWSISSKCKDPNDTSGFRERGLCVDRTRWVNMKPNIPYLLESYDEPWFRLLKPKESYMHLHDDGWLEVTVKMDSASISKRLEDKVTEYLQENLPVYKFSSLRFDYLISTIRMLQNHGEVYVVRLPVHPRVFEIDQTLMPQFGTMMEELSRRTSVPYIDLTYLNEQLSYTDGNHLYKDSGKEVSRILADSIQRLSASYASEGISQP